MKHILFLVILVAFLLSGCGAQATPTIDPAQVQASAAAAASTMMAQTQAAIPPTAIPTDTPQDTPTPLPSPTPILQPTLDTSAGFPTVAPTTAPSSGNSSCVQALDVAQAGPTHRTLIRNESNATINLSLNLYKPNQFGQCGAISFGGLSKGSTVMANLPAGYWSAYAWATGAKPFTVSGSFFVQPAQFDKLELCIRSDSIKYAQSC